MVLSSLDLVPRAVSNFTTLAVLNEQFLKFDNFHQGKGEVTLNSGQGLRVSNIGSSGGDGISVNLEASPFGPTPASQFTALLSPVNLGVGSLFKLGATGDVNGAPNNSMGEAVLNGLQQGNQLQVGATFQTLGATLVRVEIYDNNTYMGGKTMPRTISNLLCAVADDSGLG